MKYTFAKPFGHIAPGKEASREQFERQKSITERLTDPKYYPKSYKTMMEEKNAKQEELLSLASAPSSRRSSIATKQPAVFDRLTKNVKTSSKVSLKFDGYPVGFKRVDESVKEKMRTELQEAKLNRIGFLEFSGYASAAGSQRASVVSQTIEEIEEEKPRMSGYVADMPNPPRSAE
ncbi:hypothetical protein EDD86DRAFT_273695 [Gorgonomyces haynaldii]|nr:hypothetical protein EDD86DRAFT_273695 [Gorgonomyces haynaldii]